MLDEVYVSPENVVKVLSGLNSSSDTGPDGLHPHLLMACSDALSLPFYLLFEKSLDERVLPNLWNISIVVPLYKNSSRCNPLNFHCVSLTSVCCKVLERVIVLQVVEYLESYVLLSVDQFDFCKGRSVENQLLVMYGEVVELVDKGFVVDIANLSALL